MTTAAVAIFATTTSLAALDGPFEKVTVLTELGGAADANILAQYPDLESDIESAMLQRMDGKLADEGHRITVRLREIGLSGTMAGTGIEEFNRLAGFVSVYDEDGGPIENVKLTINAETGNIELPPGTVGVSWPEGADFYQAMVGAFADEAVRLVDEM
jgi:hypothetical protein